MKYLLKKETYQRDISIHRNVMKVSFTHYFICDTSQLFYSRFYTTQASNLNKFLTGVFFAGDYRDAEVEIDEEMYKLLHTIFHNQKSYGFWKDGLNAYRTSGREEAIKWMKERVPVLKLKNKLEG